MIRIFLNFTIIIVFTLSFNACSDSSDNGNSGSFKGSCMEVDMPGSVCVDYYDGYTSQLAEQLCDSTNDSFSSDTCADVNPGYTKITGKCEVQDMYGTSQISYYTNFYTETSAHQHCDTYNSIAGYSSQWISDK